MKKTIMLTEDTQAIYQVRPYALAQPQPGHCKNLLFNTVTGTFFCTEDKAIGGNSLQLLAIAWRIYTAIHPKTRQPTDYAELFYTVGGELYRLQLSGRGAVKNLINSFGSLAYIDTVGKESVAGRTVCNTVLHIRSRKEYKIDNTEYYVPEVRFEEPADTITLEKNRAFANRGPIYYALTQHCPTYYGYQSATYRMD